MIDGSITTLFVQTGPNGDVTNADPYLNAIDVAPSLTNSKTDDTGLNIALEITALGSAGGTAVDGNTWQTQSIRDYINQLDAALTKLSNDRSVMGAFMNAMESSASSLTTINLSLEEARSQIRDVDVSEASSDMVRYQILQQTSASILAQANQAPSIALTLLQG